MYRARDSKLGRDVAIKVLPEEFSTDQERLDRFEREAKLLAQLNHSNIATLHGLEESAGRKFLVMELVEGETLAERIAKGPLSLDEDEVIPLFIHIAEGLEAAHEKRIIHRDLKPANIKIGPDGKPKILDFGLAKAFLREENVSAETSQLPTRLRYGFGEPSAGTALGMIMGTASYMSPEQAKGKDVDTKTDVWAFGCCLYEALTGKKAFDGETPTDAIAAVVNSDPDWSALPSETTSRLRELIERCLRKDSRRRLNHIGDARLELEESTSAPGPDSPRGKLVSIRSVALIGILSALAGGWAASRYLTPSPTTDAHVVHATVPIPVDTQLHSANASPLAISRDGAKIVYAARVGGRSQLYLRELGEPQARPIPGSEGGGVPFLSPDGEWVGFFAAGELRKVPAAGGAPIRICDVPGAIGSATWGEEDLIVFSDLTGLFSVSANGGELRRLTDGDFTHRWPEILPGGRNLLYTSWYEDVNHLAMLTLTTGERRILDALGQAGQARYLPTGHLLFTRSNAVLAVPFDPTRGEPTGVPFIVLQGVYSAPVQLSSAVGVHYFSVSDTGTLVYAPGGDSAAARELVWVSRDGDVAPVSDQARAYEFPRLSPDGKRVVLAIHSPPHDIWVLDIERGSLTRQTLSDLAGRPIWTPDGRRVTFATGRVLYSKLVDGSSEPELVLEARAGLITAESWSPDGRILLFRELDEANGFDVWRMGIGEEPIPVLNTRFDETSPALSPDGRWLAYVSNESGREEVYVQAFPGPGQRAQVSNRGGTEPVWSHDGKELFYRDGSHLVSVPLSTEPALQPGVPRPLFEDRFASSGGDRANYDVDRDGQRFLMVSLGNVREPTELHLVLNWFEELKRIAPVDQ